MDNEADQPKIIKLPFDEQRELLAFFGMDTNPFIDAVDPTLYFKTPQHESAYKKLRHCIEDSISMGMLCAPSGMGKTLIIQLLKRNLSEEKYHIVDLRIEKGLTKAAFIKNVLYEIGFTKIFQGQNTHINDLLLLLHNRLVEDYEKYGKRLVLMIDEAQFLQLDILYLVKMISNIELPQQKLATIILFGEESLEKRIRQKNFISLSNRMFIKETLSPLNIYEMKAYLHYKLDQSGYRDELFSPEIYDVIFVATDGICREVNNLVYNALIEAFYAKKKIIDYDILLKCLN